MMTFPIYGRTNVPNYQSTMVFGRVGRLFDTEIWTEIFVWNNVGIQGDWGI